MQVVAPVDLAALLIATTAAVAACLILRSAVARRNKARSRGVFALGFACGLVAGPVLRRRRGRRALRAVIRHTGVLQARRVRSR